MVNCIYQKRSDNVARTGATITVGTGSAPSEDAYQPASLVDENPARVAKINSTTGAWLFDFGAAQAVEIAALIHHNFDAGADVKIQGNATNSWGTPSFSASFTIPTWQGSGATRWPVNPWLDLTQQSGYSPTGFRYYRIVVTSNSQNLQLGQVWLGATIRRFTRNVGRGFTLTRKRGVVSNTTGFGVATVYARHNPIWGMSFEVFGMADTQRADLQAQWDDAGGQSYPWLFVPNGDENDARLVRWATEDEQVKRLYTDLSSMAATVVEAGRGLRPGT